MTDPEKARMLKALLRAQKEGYGGILPSGTIVDRREHPEALPIPKNSLMGIPDPQPVDDQNINLLPCPFCGSEAEITDESLRDNPESWYFAWCENRKECSAWLAAASPEAVAKKWNRRTALSDESAPSDPSESP